MTEYYIKEIEGLKDKLFKIARFRYSLSKEDAEDLYQDLNLKLIKIGMKNYEDRGKFFNWLKRNFRNKCKDYIRKINGRSKIESIKRVKILRFSDIETKIDLDYLESSDYSRDFINKDTYEEIHYYTSKLSLKLRNPIEMFYFEGMKLEDIAEKLEISLSSVMDRIHRARNKLRNYLTIQ